MADEGLSDIFCDVPKSILASTAAPQPENVMDCDQNNKKMTEWQTVDETHVHAAYTVSVVTAHFPLLQMSE